MNSCRSNEIPLRISNEIRRLAESCVELDVCQRVGQMKSEQLVKSPIQSSRPGLLALYTDPLLDTQNQLTNSDTEGSDGRFSQGMVQVDREENIYTMSHEVTETNQLLYCNACGELED